MKVLMLMTLFVYGTANNSKFEQEIQKNREQTKTLLKQRLHVIESDILEIDFIAKESSCCGDLKALNHTLYHDKKMLEEVLNKFGE